MPVISYTLAAAVGLILIATGVLKLREGRGPLAETIGTFRVTPRWAVRPIAAVLPPVELAIGVCLVIGASGPWVLAAAALVLAYTACVASVILRKIATDCGCFGSVMKSQANRAVVGRNAVLVLALVPALLLPAVTFVPAWTGWVLFGAGFLIGLVRTLPPHRPSPTPVVEETSAAQSRVAVQQIGDSSWI